MSKRKIKQTVRGKPTVDGAGVHLVRVLGPKTMYDFDPFLMLDSFDSRNPEDYTAGFPHHPHRGIETVTYLISGEIDHEDSLGNAGRIGPGQSQWMTAGSGIIHQEMPRPSERMLGLQLWINLPHEEKMVDPQYFDIRDAMIGEKKIAGGIVRVISGEYGGVKGAKTDHVQATLLDVSLNEGESVSLPTKNEDNVFVFLIEGDAVIDGEHIPEKNAVLFGEGSGITLSAPEGKPARFIFFSGKPVREEISWGGPIVMTTKEELKNAFLDIDNGTFIKHAPHFSTQH